MLRLFDALEGLRIILGEREQHTERLKVLSETDGLTGLINRRLFDRIGQGEPEFDSLPHDVSVIMMDLDRFKGVNDTYGHLAGDLVLKHAAMIVQRVCRKSDLAARYGGEEISIVILEQDGWVAMHVAERIRSELEARNRCCSTTDAASMPPRASAWHMASGAVRIGSASSRRPMARSMRQKRRAAIASAGLERRRRNRTATWREPIPCCRCQFEHPIRRCCPDFLHDFACASFVHLIKSWCAAVGSGPAVFSKELIA